MPWLQHQRFNSELLVQVSTLRRGIADFVRAQRLCAGLPFAVGRERESSCVYRRWRRIFVFLEGVFLFFLKPGRRIFVFLEAGRVKLWRHFRQVKLGDTVPNSYSGQVRLFKRVFKSANSSHSFLPVWIPT